MDYKIAPKTLGMDDANEGFRPDFWQGNNGECAIHAQFRILQDYGYTGTVADLRQEAIDHGWFDPATGTSSENIGKLLELHNVPCDMYFDANRYNLINELAQGKRIIVTVDSSELWHENSILEKSWEKFKDFFGNGADHALVVSGINTEDPDNIKVVLTDSGDGHRTISYPIEQFEDAWRDGHCQMIVTHEPPPQELAFGRLTDPSNIWSMEHFDYSLGHVSNIGEHTFEEWQDINDANLSDVRIVSLDEYCDSLVNIGASGSSVESLSYDSNEPEDGLMGEEGELEDATTCELDPDEDADASDDMDECGDEDVG